MQAFFELADHAWHGREFKRLKKEERISCVAFIQENDALDVQAFEYAANRWFLDKPDRPKNWTMMWGLVTAANSRAFLARSSK